MSYEPTNWKAGDTVTSAKLNKMEQGIAGAGVLVVGFDNETGALDKTWQEIHDAGFAVIWIQESSTEKCLAFIFNVYDNSGYYCVDAVYIVNKNNGEIRLFPETFSTDSADGYPVAEEDSSESSESELNPVAT